MGLLDRLTPRRPEPEVRSTPVETADQPLFATKALKKLVAALATRESPSLLDLGPVIGANLSFFGEQLGCKFFVEDVYGELERHVKSNKLEDLASVLTKRFSQPAPVRLSYRRSSVALTISTKTACS